MTRGVDARVTRAAIARRVTRAGARWLARTTSTAAGVTLAAAVVAMAGGRLVERALERDQELMEREFAARLSGLSFVYGSGRAPRAYEPG